MNQSISNKSGFTLLEIIYSLALVGLIGTTLSVMMRQGLNIYTLAENQNEATLSANSIVNQIESDLSFIKQGQMKWAGSRLIWFQKTNDEILYYYYVNGVLYRNRTIIATGISRFAFSYLNAKGSFTNLASEVKSIYATIERKTNSGVVHSRAFVFLRDGYYESFKNVL